MGKGGEGGSLGPVIVGCDSSRGGNAVEGGDGGGVVEEEEAINLDRSYYSPPPTEAWSAQQQR